MMAARRTASFTIRSLAAAALLWQLCGLLQASSAADEPLLLQDTFRGFITTSNGRFVDEDCREFPVVGMNGWQLMESAAGFANFTDVDGLDAVQYTFAQAARDGQTVVRVFGHGINQTLALQESPGVYNESAFYGLDYVLDTAATYGVRVLFTMADYWLGVDGFTSYVKWANLTDNPDRFFWEDVPRQMFKAHMNAMANRRNSINGLLYKEDPAIFAWDLMNEVRCDCFPHTLYNVQLPPACTADCANNVTAWVNEMSQYLKSIDSSHLITVGEEGYWSSNDPMAQYNPGNGWASLTGQNFTAQHASRNIDFAAIHYWPDLWTTSDSSNAFGFLDNWIRFHEVASKSLGKPLIMEEFGKNATIGLGNAQLQDSIQQKREPVFSHIYSALNSSLTSGDSLRGAMFWQWGMNPVNSDGNNIEVAANDVDYQNVVVPAAVQALQYSEAVSPLANCNQAGNSALAPANGGTPTIVQPGSAGTVASASINSQTAGR